MIFNPIDVNNVNSDYGLTYSSAKEAMADYKKLKNFGYVKASLRAKYIINKIRNTQNILRRSDNDKAKKFVDDLEDIKALCIEYTR